MPLRWTDSVVALLLSSKKRLDSLRQAIGATDLRWISAYVSTKPARSPALWWHQDWWCWDHPATFERRAPQVALLCYFTETRRGNGALRVIPGTHHQSTSLHEVLPEAHASAADQLGPDHAALSDHPDQCTIEASAGDAVVMDYRLLHGTHPNSTATDRECVLLTFAPSWASLPADVKGHLIQHPALPCPDEQPSAEWADVLPCFQGVRRDLPLNRNAPALFLIE